MDVDAGPVMTETEWMQALRLGAARKKNGRFDRAYPLAAEMLANCGRTTPPRSGMPQILSNFTDAPARRGSYLGYQHSTGKKGLLPERGKGIPQCLIVFGNSLLRGVWLIWMPMENEKILGGLICPSAPSVSNVI